MKCQRNAPAWRSCFARRSWSRFSPTTSTPASASAAMREESRLVTRRAAADAVDAHDTGGAQRPLHGGGEVEASLADETEPERCPDGPRDVRVDLVAARADPRADRGGVDHPAERAHPVSDDSSEEAAPADVEERERRPALEADDRDRQAIGGDDHQRPVPLVRPEAVARLPAAVRAPYE